jgi:hypothetical protein
MPIVKVNLFVLHLPREIPGSTKHEVIFWDHRSRDRLQSLRMEQPRICDERRDISCRSATGGRVSVWTAVGRLLKRPCCLIAMGNWDASGAVMRALYHNQCRDGGLPHRSNQHPEKGQGSLSRGDSYPACEPSALDHAVSSKYAQ